MVPIALKGAIPGTAFNNTDWESETSFTTDRFGSMAFRDTPSPGRVAEHCPGTMHSAASQDRLAISEKVMDYQESLVESTVQYERTKDRRSLGGIVYGPPPGAPPGHYKRPAPPNPPEMNIARMSRSEFRNGMSNSVIEVLLEEPRVSIRGRQRKSSSIGTGRDSQTRSRELPVIRQNPKRVRIRSVKLLTALESLAKSASHSFLTGGTTTVVFLHPFKLFVTLEPYIREKLAGLELDLQTSQQSWSVSDEHDALRFTSPYAESHAEPDGSSIESNTQGSLRRIELRPSIGAERKSAHFAQNEKDDKETLQCLRLLVELFDTDLRPMFEMRREIKEKTLGSIVYSDLWHLFEFGQDVRTADSDNQVYRVLRWTGGRETLAKHGLWAEMQARAVIDAQALQKSEDRSETFIVECASFEFDGSHYGPVQKTFVIRKYEGEKPITSLPIYPLVFDPAEEKIRQRLLARGNLYLQISQIDKATHKHYTGLTMDEPHEEVDSQIIVDTKMAMLRYYTSLPPVGLGSLIGHNLRETYEETVNPTVPDGVCSEDGCCDNDRVHKDYSWQLESENLFLDEHRSVLAPTTDPGDIEDEEKLLLPPYVYGFVLRSRKWAMFDIALMKDVTYSSGFDDLVLPPGHKETVRALVANHAPNQKGRKSHNSIDLVKGKGKGLVILLHGAPGVGKTSTAECVADSTKRPLFPITCGDIGDTASEVEANLESSFQLAHKWGCVLLLDEADIFLQKRDKADIKRNSIVSVFLRTLEYYSGILFLTTNRVGLFDPAFRSRIHISLFYPGLQKEATMQIWKMHLARTQEMKGEDFKIKTKEILKFAKEHYMELKRAKTGSWNGRQIRNAFQTAIALAEFEAAEENENHPHHRRYHVELGRQHFETVAQASKEFDKYLRSTLGGQTESDLARLEQTRVDDFHALMERAEQTERAQRAKERGRRKVRVETDSEESEPDDSEASDEDEHGSQSSESANASDKEERLPVKPSRKKNHGKGRK